MDNTFVKCPKCGNEYPMDNKKCPDCETSNPTLNEPRLTEMGVDSFDVDNSAEKWLKNIADGILAVCIIAAVIILLATFSGEMNVVLGLSSSLSMLVGSLVLRFFVYVICNISEKLSQISNQIAGKK